jgi:hypothetical protein
VGTGRRAGADCVGADEQQAGQQAGESAGHGDAVTD